MTSMDRHISYRPGRRWFSFLNATDGDVGLDESHGEIEDEELTALLSLYSDDELELDDEPGAEAPLDAVFQER
jgi:hypothetical protein